MAAKRGRHWLLDVMDGFVRGCLATGAIFLGLMEGLGVLIGVPAAVLLDLALSPVFISTGTEAQGIQQSDNIIWTIIIPVGFSAVTTALQYIGFWFIRDCPDPRKWSVGQWAAMTFTFIIMAVDTAIDEGGITSTMYNAEIAKNILPPPELRTTLWWAFSIVGVIVCAGHEPLMRVMLSRRRIKKKGQNDNDDDD